MRSRPLGPDRNASISQLPPARAVSRLGVNDERTHIQEAAMDTLFVLALFLTRLLIPVAILLAVGTLLTGVLARKL